MPSHKHRQAQVALAVGKSHADTNLRVTRALGLIRGENNDLWEIALKEQGVDERIIRHAAKYVREQQATLDDTFIRQETGLIR